MRRRENRGGGGGAARYDVRGKLYYFCEKILPYELGFTLYFLAVLQLSIREKGVYFVRDTNEQADT